MEHYEDKHIGRYVTDIECRTAGAICTMITVKDFAETDDMVFVKTCGPAPSIVRGAICDMLVRMRMSDIYDDTRSTNCLELRDLLCVRVIVYNPDFGVDRDNLSLVWEYQFLKH